MAVAANRLRFSVGVQALNVTALHGQVMGARSFKGPVLALLAANTAVCMSQCDGFLSTRLFNEYYSHFPTRIDSVVTGGPSAPLQLSLGVSAVQGHLFLSRALFFILAMACKWCWVERC